MRVVDLFFIELPHLRLSRLCSLLASSILTASAKQCAPPQRNGFKCYRITPLGQMYDDAEGKDFCGPPPSPPCVAVSNSRPHFLYTNLRCWFAFYREQLSLLNDIARDIEQPSHHPIMRLFSYSSAFLAVATSTLAAPPHSGHSSSSNRSDTPDTSSALDCSQFDPVSSGNYIVNPDQWGQVSSTTCVQVDSSSGDSVSWSAQWSWPDGGANVKSYPNAELSNWECKPLSSYNSIRSSWNWK